MKDNIDIKICKSGLNQEWDKKFIKSYKDIKVKKIKK